MKSEVIVSALVVSVIVHLGVMFYAKPKVMTSVAGGVSRRVATAPMRVTKAVERPEPVKIDAVADLEAARDAPAAEKPASAAPVPAEAPDVEPAAVSAAVASLDDPAPSVEPLRPVFEESLSAPSPEGLLAKIPAAKIEAPPPAAPGLSAAPAAPEAPAAPSVSPLAASALPLPAAGTDPDSMFLPTTFARETPAAVAKQVADFRPSEEIYEKVDEKVVEAEKAAVKALVESDAAEDLPKFASVAMTACEEGGWRYFKVMVAPRAALAVVPKDVVLLLDASGSIGSDRIGSVRKAAKRFLRSATNSDDRFNLVAFRDRFSYAFRAWQPCTQAAFDRADKWLNNVAAHGRTDVFATISSVLTLPRDPRRPLVALVVTDGDANSGVRSTAEILSKFTALNDGLVSVYMYGVKSSANRELLEALTRGNRGESYVFEGSRWSAGEGIEGLSERFRDPVLSDLRVIFASDTPAEAYPRVLKNLCRGGVVELVGRVPAGTERVSFALRGLNGATAYEGFFRLDFATAGTDPSLAADWRGERAIDAKLR